MQIEIGYNLNSLQESAQYIWNHNPHVSRWPTPPSNVFELMQQIKNQVRRDVQRNVEILKREKDEGIDLTNEWIHMTGTGGYTIMYSLEDNTDDKIYIGVDFLVDPAVGNKNDSFVTEVLDFTNETV